MTTIKDIQIGHTFQHHKYGKGMVSGKTQRTITATFENGMTVKNTYKYADAYFYGSDF